MTVYHILPESEPFSEYYGGALSRWAANVLRNDDSAVIVAPWCDGSWNWTRQVRTIGGLRCYQKAVALCRDRIPARVRGFLAALALGGVRNGIAPEDAVYVHNRPEFAAAIHRAWPRRKFKLILHMHNSHLLHHPAEFARSADLTVFCSSFLLREAQNAVGGIPSAVIPNGADPRFFFPAVEGARRGGPVILFAGRLVPAKGAHVLVEAMRMLECRGADARAVIIGSAGFGAQKDTPYIRQMKQTAPTNVEFAPYRTGGALADAFRQATIFCCPSVFREPFGMVNVEAMACGLAVVASDVGGIPEVFEEGGALLVPPNDPAKLADALETLLSDAEVRGRLARAGEQSFRKNFTWDVVRGKYCEVLARVAA